MQQQMAIMLIAIGGVLLLGILILIARTWRQVDQGRAMIVNKMGTEPKVTFTGAIVLPIVNKMEIMDLSVKTIEVSRRGKDGCVGRQRRELVGPDHPPVRGAGGEDAEHQRQDHHDGGHPRGGAPIGRRPARHHDAPPRAKPAAPLAWRTTAR